MKFHKNASTTNRIGPTGFAFASPNLWNFCFLLDIKRNRSSYLYLFFPRLLCHYRYYQRFFIYVSAIILDAQSYDTLLYRQVHSTRFTLCLHPYRKRGNARASAILMLAELGKKIVKENHV